MARSRAAIACLDCVSMARHQTELSRLRLKIKLPPRRGVEPGPPPPHEFPGGEPLALSITPPQARGPCTGRRGAGKVSALLIVWRRVAEKKTGVPKRRPGGNPGPPALDVVTVPVLTQKENEFSAPSYLRVTSGGVVCQLLRLQSRNTEVLENSPIENRK